jgi:hypothetical protein
MAYPWAYLRYVDPTTVLFPAAILVFPFFGMSLDEPRHSQLPLVSAAYYGASYKFGFHVCETD